MNVPHPNGRPAAYEEEFSEPGSQSFERVKDRTQAAIENMTVGIKLSREINFQFAFRL